MKPCYHVFPDGEMCWEHGRSGPDHPYLPLAAVMAQEPLMECDPLHDGLGPVSPEHFQTWEQWWHHALCCHWGHREFDAWWAEVILEQRGMEAVQ